MFFVLLKLFIARVVIIKINNINSERGDVENTTKKYSLNIAPRGSIRVPSRAEIVKSPVVVATAPKIQNTPTSVPMNHTSNHNKVAHKTSANPPRVTFETMMNSAPVKQTTPMTPMVVATQPTQLAEIAEIPAPVQTQPLQTAVQVAASQEQVSPMAVSQVALVGADSMPVTQVAPMQETVAAVDKPKTKTSDKLKNGAKKIKAGAMQAKNLTKHAKKLKNIKMPNMKVKPADMMRYAVVAVVLIISGYLAYDTWTTNQQAKDIFSQPAAAADGSGVVDESSNPDESALDVDSLSSYEVAPDMPRFLTIPKIGVNARIINTGLTAGNKIASPSSIHDTGWYTASSKPGEKGAAFIDGHIAGTNLGGVFQNLSKLSSGDSITIERGDGTKFNYKVTDVAIIPVAQVNMGEVLSVKNGAEQGLNLMTCAGRFTSSGYEQRVIIYSVKV